MDSITITLPIPHKSLSSNARVHWGERARHVAKARMDGYYAALKAGGAKLWWSKATARVTWYARTLRVIDTLNINHYLKAYFDGIEDAGVVQNDRDIDVIAYDQRKDAENPRVEIELERKA